MQSAHSHLSQESIAITDNQQRRQVVWIAEITEAAIQSSGNSMFIRTFSFLMLALVLSLFGSLIDLAFGAPIEEALKTLRGLSPKERLTRVENEARKEGSVRWASSTPQAWAEPALQIFRKRHPTIQIEYMRQSGRVLAERIIREHRAGKYDVDIIGTSAVTFAGMKDSGVIAPYVSPEAAQLRQNMKDPAGWWVAYFGNIQAIYL
jgi:hypothetical protein